MWQDAALEVDDVKTHYQMAVSKGAPFPCEHKPGEASCRNDCQSGACIGAVLGKCVGDFHSIAERKNAHVDHHVISTDIGPNVIAGQPLTANTMRDIYRYMNNIE